MMDVKEFSITPKALTMNLTMINRKCYYDYRSNY